MTDKKRVLILCTGTPLGARQKGCSGTRLVIVMKSIRLERPPRKFGRKRLQS